MEGKPRKKRVRGVDTAARKQARNTALRKRFEFLTKKHPQWRVEAIIEQVAGEFFISSATAYHIITGQGPYKNS